MTPTWRLSDERLAKLARTGDERALTLLFERHGPGLYRYCRSIVHHDQDAQDVVQTTMLRAIAALRRSELEGALRPWLFRIAHNESITLLRRRRPTDDIDEQSGVTGVPIEVRIEDRERLTTLVADLRELPERQRAALVMRELNGLSHAEISTALDIPLSATKQAIFEARRGLQAAQAGRDMACEPVQRAISDGDGRVLRARNMRAHVRTCGQCRAMRDAIGARERDLGVLVPPLPPAGGALLLDRILEAGSGHGDAIAGGTVAVAGAAAAGKAAVGALSGKVLTIAAVVLTAAGAATVVATHGGGTPSDARAARQGADAGPGPGAALLSGTRTTAFGGVSLATSGHRAGGGSGHGRSGGSGRTSSGPGSGTQPSSSPGTPTSPTAHDVAQSGASAATGVAGTGTKVVGNATGGGTKVVGGVVNAGTQTAGNVVQGTSQTVDHAVGTGTKVVGGLVGTGTKATGDVTHGAAGAVSGLLGQHGQ